MITLKTSFNLTPSLSNSFCAFCAFLWLTFFVAQEAHAQNWPQWRGPALNGVSSETNLPVKWTTEENVAWKVAMPGFSGSTPIIWRDRIFLNVADGDNLFLWCLDK